MPPRLKADDEEDEQPTESPEKDLEVEVEATDETSSMTDNDDESIDPEEAEEETEEAEEETDDDEPEVEEVDLPDDEKYDDESSTGGSLLDGKTLGISNRLLLIAGIIAVLGVLYLRWLRTEANASRVQHAPASDEEVDEQFEADEGVPEDDFDPAIVRDDSNPLAADEEAMGYIFGGE